ncbi:F0F1 ATP synthase subunit A [Tepidiforma thermophila]|uniref:ATP synthase subunit a n=1 Tax=Tepidiforma thermophila (strain KCTC 52669 / CGMCC 1.13589 / G233) TaxID=2761530 RepID=A0A2A9HEF2_TEPT2|nr:F0F1 ATP synthase subunit A [Tepidiforma thermophila]PFG74397.1 ATP synthase A subunit [Tepidiforma thermophila]
MKIILIAVVVLAVLATGFFVAAGPEPHIVIPGEVVWKVGFMPITSTLMASWLAMAVLILGTFLMTRSMKLIPSGAQNFIESIIEFLYGQVEEIAGEKNTRRFFPVVGTFFLFILVANWIALTPIFKSIGWTKDYGHEIFHEIQEKAEKGKVFDKNKHFLAWQMEDAGGVGVAAPGARTFKFEIHEGDDPADVVDRYIVALAEFYTDFEAQSDAAHGEGHASREDVEAAFAALQADPKAPKFIAADKDAHAKDGEKHHGVTSHALGVTFTALEFPGDKIALVYPFFRAAFSELNNTLALAIFAFLAIEFWGFQSLGIGYLGKFFISPLKNPVLTFVGLLELISEFIRIISFSFRLFGNIFAGGVLLLILTFLAPFVAPLGIYGLELFVGLIQAIVFSLLLLVFAVGAVEHHGDEEHHDGDHHGGEGHETAHHLEPGAVQAH